MITIQMQCLYQVTSVAPELEMADYRVTYSKHKQFKEGKGERGSIVRIFTNINLRLDHYYLVPHANT